jgi:hypothetical protein
MNDCLTLDGSLGTFQFEATLLPKDKNFELILVGFDSIRGRASAQTKITRRASSYTELGAWLRNNAPKLAMSLAGGIDMPLSNSLSDLLRRWSAVIVSGSPATQRAAANRQTRPVAPSTDDTPVSIPVARMPESTVIFSSGSYRRLP